jgi:hemerythrin superfamily protein
MAANEHTDSDLIAAIRSDHEKVKALLEGVASAAPGSARAEAFRQLLVTASAHEAAEQELVHPLARPGSGGDTVVDARLQEEAQGKQGLTELERLGVDAPEFEEKFTELKAAIIEHAQKEEQDEHPILREVVSETRLRELAGEYRAAEDRAKAQP